MAVTIYITRGENEYKIEAYKNYLGEFDYDVLNGPKDLVLTDDETISSVFAVEEER